MMVDWTRMRRWAYGAKIAAGVGALVGALEASA